MENESIETVFPSANSFTQEKDGGIPDLLIVAAFIAVALSYLFYQVFRKKGQGSCACGHCPSSQKE